LISLGYKWYYIFNDTNHYLSNFSVENGAWNDKNAYFSAGIDKYIRELDIAGLLGGIVGIFIGLYLTILNEKMSRIKERTNQQDMDRLKTQTDLLVQATSSLNNLMIDVSGKVNEKVQLIEGTKDVLNGIGRVIDSSKSQGNNLLILSNTARIEAISHYRLEYVAKHSDLKPHELKNASQFDYARKVEALQRDCIDIDNKLREAAIYLQSLNNGARVELATLNELADGANHAFLKYLGRIFNEFATVEFYRSGSNSPLIGIENIAYHNRFLFATSNKENDDPQGSLIKQIYDDHAKAIAEMSELNIKITKLNKTLPIQLFISSPRMNQIGLQKGLCVCVMGSGASSSGRPAKLTAFVTDDPHIVASMTELFYDYEAESTFNTQEFIRSIPS
jgi:uncharacterized protein YoxC